jgi:hypothetical protein
MSYTILDRYRKNQLEDLETSIMSLGLQNKTAKLATNMGKSFPLSFVRTLMPTLFLVLFLSCHDPVDYNEGFGYVVGRESCNSDSTKNAWLISFVKPPLFDAEKLNDSIVFNGKLYRRVVKTFRPIQNSCLLNSRNQQGNNYCYFRFNIILPKKYSCDSSKSYNLPEISDLTSQF